MINTNLKNIFHFFCLLSMLYSCNSDPSDKFGETSLKQIVASQSGGKIILDNFFKSNGIKKELMGQEIYTMEFNSQITFVENVWKTWEVPIEGVFTNFNVSIEKPTRNIYNITLEKQRFYKDAKINLEGEINFEKTDNGWRNTKVIIKKYTILSNPSPNDLFIGTWFKEDYNSEEIVITKLDGNKLEPYQITVLGNTFSCVENDLSIQYKSPTFDSPDGWATNKLELVDQNKLKVSNEPYISYYLRKK